MCVNIETANTANKCTNFIGKYIGKPCLFLGKVGGGGGHLAGAMLSCWGGQRWWRSMRRGGHSGAETAQAYQKFSKERQCTLRKNHTRVILFFRVPFFLRKIFNYLGISRTLYNLLKTFFCISHYHEYFLTLNKSQNSKIYYLFSLNKCLTWRSLV